MPRSNSRLPGHRNGTPMITRLLPLPDEEVRQRLIEYHMTLANLRRRRGDLGHFVTMARVIVSTCPLFDEGYGEASLHGLMEVHDALERSLRVSVETGRWGVDETTFELLADRLIVARASTGHGSASRSGQIDANECKKLRGSMSK